MAIQTIIENADESVSLRRLLVSADGTITASGTGTYKIDVGNPVYAFPRMQCDADDATLVPLAPGTQTKTLARVLKDGTIDFQVDITAPAGNNGTKADAGDPNGPAAGYLGYAIAFDPAEPDYDGQITTKRPEFLYLGVPPETSGQPGLHKVRLVSRTVTPGDPRSTALLVAVGGDLKVVDVSQTAGSQITTPTGGSGATSPSGQFTAFLEYDSRLFIIDGQSELVYNPRTDTVEPWVAQTGEIPKTCRLAAVWSDRIVLARPSGADGAGQQYFFSEQGNAFGWDFLPNPPTATQAIAFNTLRSPGPAPDIINALIPWTKDWLLIGGDQSIHVLRGDPAVNGFFTRVSDITGMAFGKSWCKDDRGDLYFAGTQGGFYRVRAGTLAVEPIADGRVDRELRAGLKKGYDWRVAWDQERRQVLVSAVERPANDGSVTNTEPVAHLVYERDLDAWWADEYADADHNPQTYYALDGDDPADRVLLKGCADGYLRFADDTATDDDGTPIESLVVIGPIQPKQPGTRFIYQRVELHAQGNGAIKIDLSARNNPTKAGAGPDRTATRTLTDSGGAVSVAARVLGQYAFITLSPGQAEAMRWACDQITVEYDVGGPY